MITCYIKKLDNDHLLYKKNWTMIICYIKYLDNDHLLYKKIGQ